MIFCLWAQEQNVLLFCLSPSRQKQNHKTISHCWPSDCFLSAVYFLSNPISFVNKLHCVEQFLEMEVEPRRLFNGCLLFLKGITIWITVMNIAVQLLGTGVLFIQGKLKNWFSNILTRCMKACFPVANTPPQNVLTNSITQYIAFLVVCTQFTEISQVTNFVLARLLSKCKNRILLPEVEQQKACMHTIPRQRATYPKPAKIFQHLRQKILKMFLSFPGCKNYSCVRSE